jgi:hypothetical protein
MWMRTLLGLCLVLAGCGNDGHLGPISSGGRWVLADGAANIAVLQVDFITYNLEGGVLGNSILCDSCDSTGLPLRFTTRPPGDFGWNLFQHEASGDTVFFGTTVWSGRGDRIIPRVLVPADSFEVVAGEIPAPVTKQYYFSYPFQDDERGRALADSAWLTVKNLDITRAFANHAYRVGFYIYPRTVGVFAPAQADVIVFLYAGIRPSGSVAAVSCPFDVDSPDVTDLRHAPRQLPHRLPARCGRDGRGVSRP